MSINFDFPDELEFFEREFGLSDKNENDEGIISYLKQYESGRELVVTILPYGYDSSVTVEIIEDNTVLASITRDNVTSVTFQGWGKEQAIRVEWEGREPWEGGNYDFIIFYNPIPKFFYGELS